MTMQPFDPGSFFDVGSLEETEFGRRALFESFIPPSFGQVQQQQLGTLFQPTFNRFLGQIGGQIRGGEDPTQSFTQFLEQNFNPQRQALRFGQQRGPQQSATRFNFAR